MFESERESRSEGVFGLSFSESEIIVLPDFFALEGFGSSLESREDELSVLFSVSLGVRDVEMAAFGSSSLGEGDDAISTLFRIILVD